MRSANVTFPLTPALSLGEREHRRPRGLQFAALDWSRDWLRFPLSLRERAGVGEWGFLKTQILDECRSARTPQAFRQNQRVAFRTQYPLRRS
jgi:hypothetical protein